MDNLIVRPAELKDSAGIAKVHVETWQCAYKGQIPDSFLESLSVEKRTENWNKNLSDPENKTKTFVAELDNKIVGFGSAGHCRDEDMGNDTGELWAIYVDQNHMGKGIGSAIQQACFNYLRELGFKSATLWVLTSNEKTKKWYEGKGWRVEGKTKTDKREDFDLEETRYITDLTK